MEPALLTVQAPVTIAQTKCAVALANKTLRSK
jgi:hypothetical protein